MTMFRKSPDPTPDADLERQLAALDARLAELGERRMATMTVVRSTRAQALACKSPAVGPVAVRDALLAEAVARLTAAEIEDAAVAGEVASVRAERDTLAAERVRHEAARKAARTDDQVRAELA